MSTWIADAERCRTIDRRATAEFGVSEMVLMERAGMAVFNALKELLPEGGTISVLAGKGNNGGDAFVLARLASDSGYGVECLVAAESPEQLRSEARFQMLQAAAAGVQPIFCDDARWKRRLEAMACRDLIVDGLLGTGTDGTVRGPVAEAIQAANRSGTPVLSIDVPSGIHTDTGEELGESIWALRTITLGLPKPFLFQNIGLEHSGFWSIADIGYPSELMREHTGALLIDGAWVSQHLPERLRASHKGENGRVLVVAGSRNMPGAAVLAARSALRSGAGLVTVAATERVCDIVAHHVPEAIFLPLPELGGVVDPCAAEIILDNTHKWDAAVIGPGLTHKDPIKLFLRNLWAEWTLPIVIDADALNAVSQGVPLPNAPCILTPHPGEMSRLLECSTGEVQADRFDTARLGAEKLRHTVLLKGPYSLICAPDEPLLVNTTGNPGMASGGMGDVLSGVIATLAANELPPSIAAAAGAFWHGYAGDLCAKEMASIGYSASDVANALPKARAEITTRAFTDA